MVKLPKQVKEVVRRLKEKGFKAYASGICVRDALAGKEAAGWDISTDADLENIREIFPECKVLSTRLGVVRIPAGDEEDAFDIDISTFRKAIGESGAVEFSDNIEDDLARRDFTVNAMADSGDKFVDPYNGKSDLQAKLVRAVSDPDAMFKKDPIRMLKAIRITAELDCDLTQDVYEAIKENHLKLRELSSDKIRREFTAIMGADHPGKALNMLVDTGLLGDIIGEDVYDHLTQREKSDLMIMCQNLDKTKPVASRRLGMLIFILGEKKGMKVIEKLGFEGELRQNLEDVACDMPSFHYAQMPQVYKKFIYEHAPMQRSEYLLNLQKAILIVFDYSIDTKIKSKMYMLGEFEQKGEPIFVEDLAIDANDLMEAGILDDPEECDKMLHMLIERLHIEPAKNTRKELFKLANTYKKNKLKAYLRGISWIH